MQFRVQSKRSAAVFRYEGFGPSKSDPGRKRSLAVQVGSISLLDYSMTKGLEESLTPEERLEVADFIAEAKKRKVNDLAANLLEEVTTHLKDNTDDRHSARLEAALQKFLSKNEK